VSLRIVYAGTPAFAVPALEAVVAAGHDVVAVLTQPDRPAGRGRMLQMSAVKESALAQGLVVLQPSNLRDTAAVAMLGELRPDVIVVAAYGLIFPAVVLDLPTLGCINIHPSLLPRWRGAAPIQHALLAGDSETGVAIMKMVPALDAGSVFATERVDIEPHEDAIELSARLAGRGARLLLQVLRQLEEGTALASQQPAVGITYASKIERSMARIDWRRSAGAIDCQVRALVPWPVAETRFMEAPLKVHGARPVAGQNVAPGVIAGVDTEGVLVGTGDGLLCLTQVQLPGRRIVSGAEFARNALKNRSLVGLTLDGVQ
jgi:methionyl-tRNA formyltransferase